MTEVALEMFDPDLRLVFNRRYNLFQVMRVRKRLSRFWSEDLGNLGVLEDVLVWAIDWKEGLEGRDDPRPLIHELWECDVLRHPKLMAERRKKVEENIARARETISDNYKYAVIDNWRQLQKVYEPMVNSPSFVR
jgi:hypothetical protein